MTVLCCGVAADTGNVDPVPKVDADGRVEYVPIPEKGPTTETATYGTIERRHGSDSLAPLVDRVRPNSDGDWIDDPAAVRDQPVHRDPNLEVLTYGEHRPPYVARLTALDPGDVVAFYAGCRSTESAYTHRYLIGAFTVASDPVVLDPAMDRATKRAILEAHPDNAHAKRFAGHGDCYYHDPALTDRPRPVVIVDGERPGGPLGRAIRLSEARRGPNYYMDPAVAGVLEPRRRGEHGTHLGGFKPAVPCDVSPARFWTFLERRDATPN